LFYQPKQAITPIITPNHNVTILIIIIVVAEADAVDFGPPPKSDKLSKAPFCGSNASGKY